MRTFLGLELAADDAIRIADWRDRQFGAGGRPVPWANFHITLAFIGEIAMPSLERLCHGVDGYVAHEDIAGAELLLDCTGYWPKPGIHWLGPQSWPDSLSVLASKLRHRATRAGARRDRNPFRPHVTLFRNCSTAPPAPTVPPAISMSYRHLTLFESRQGRNGVSYHPLQHWDLVPPGR